MTVDNTRTCELERLQRTNLIVDGDRLGGDSEQDGGDEEAWWQQLGLGLILGVLLN